MIVSSLKISSLLEDLVAEDSFKGSWEAVENVWEMVKSQGKVRKKSGNFAVENEWQPYIDKQCRSDQLASSETN